MTLLKRFWSRSVLLSKAAIVTNSSSQSLRLRRQNFWRPRAQNMEDRARGAATAKAIVLYHYPCPDGVFAALAAHLYHSAIGCPALFLPNTVYQPLTVQDLSVEGVDEFYLLDYAGPTNFAVGLARKAKQAE
ncbi:hypothetical protein R1flu_023660 [Riccia fluitans]|uniref:Uncharacterized protein n=1 Tax=Riccia fluitans TaxID=41844 RepID=A0ABD1XWR0_9MARC